MAFTATAADIVNSAAVELALTPFSQQPTDPFGSPDPNIGRLCQMLKTACPFLRAERQWTFLRQTYTFNTATDVGRYALPSDYGQFVDQTAWNRTNRLPLGGPLSPQEFEYLEARLVGVVFTVLFEVLQGKFQAYPAQGTPGDYVIAYEYVSSFTAIPASTTTASAGTWQPNTTYSAGASVINGGSIYSTGAGGTSGTYGPIGTSGSISDGGITDWGWVSASGLVTPTASTDVIQLPATMVSRYLKLLWKRELGFDVSAAEREYQQHFDKAADDDSVAAVLNLGRGRMEEPLIGERNLPFTGFGS